MPFEPTLEQQEILGHDPARYGVILAGPGTGRSAIAGKYVVSAARPYKALKEIVTGVRAGKARHL